MFSRTGTTGAVTHRYLHGVLADQVLADNVVQQGTVNWLLADHQGSIRRVIGPSGALVANISYDSFGNVTSAVTPATIDLLFGYTGQQYDEETGLAHYKFRYYDPYTGKFLREDPEREGSNFYVYVGNNSVNLTDPWGLSATQPLSSGSYGAIGGGLVSSAGSFLQSTRQYVAPMPLPPVSSIPMATRNVAAPSPLPLSSGSSIQPSSAQLDRQLGTILSGSRTSGGLVDYDSLVTSNAPSLASSIANTPLYSDLVGSLPRVTPQASPSPVPYIVGVNQIGGTVVGDVFRQPGRAMADYVQTTSSPAGAFAAQFLQPIVSAAGWLTGGLVDAALPPSDPSYEVVYNNGHREYSISGGPSTGALASQAALLTGPFIKPTTPAPKPVHGNSLEYVGDTHVYRIIGPDGKTYKIGESMQGVRIHDSASIRGEQQARQLTRETGDVYRSEIRKTFPDKRAAREYETQVIERFRRMFGPDSLPGNKLNR